MEILEIVETGRRGGSHLLKYLTTTKGINEPAIRRMVDEGAT